MLYHIPVCYRMRKEWVITDAIKVVIATVQQLITHFNAYSPLNVSVNLLMSDTLM